MRLYFLVVLLCLSCGPGSRVAPLRRPTPAPPPPKKQATVVSEEQWPGACPDKRPERCVVVAEAQRQLGQRMRALVSGLQAYVAAARLCTTASTDGAQATPPLEVVDRARAFVHREFFFPEPLPVPRLRLFGLERTLSRRCKAGDLDACLGGALVDHGLRRFEQAARMLARACDGGHGLACARLGEAHNHGLGVEADVGRAAALFQKSVDLGCARGKARLGEQLWQGKGVEHDLCRAMELWEEACEAGDQLGCALFGERHCSDSVVAKKDERRCTELPQEACRRHNDRGCVLAAASCAKNPKGQLEAFELLKRSCANGLHSACGYAASFYGQDGVVGRDRAMEDRLLERACVFGDGETCALLGYWHEEGRHGRRKDIHKANDYYARGCRHADGAACRRLADSYQLGRGVPVDQERAELLRAKASKLSVPFNMELLQRNPVVKCKPRRKR